MNDCGHRHREPVRTMAGEIVAQICLDCDEALIAEWGCLDCGWDWLGVLGQPRLRMLLMERCERHQWSAS